MSIKEIAKRNGVIRAIYEGAKQNRLYKHGCFIVNASHKETMVNKAALALEKYSACVDESLDLKRITQDMISMYRKYGYGFDEYLIYHFHEKSISERQKFVSDWERIGYANAFNQPQNAMIFDNKLETYRTFKSYYKRRVLLCRSVGG